VCDNGWVQLFDNKMFDAQSKTSPFDYGIRTPIMFSYPGKIKPEDSPELASSIDIVPTVLNLLGIRKDKRLEGIDLLDSKKRKSRKAVYGDIYVHDAFDLYDPSQNLAYRWIVEKDWKLFLPEKDIISENVKLLWDEWFSRRKDLPTTEAGLFQITEDPYETNNLLSRKQSKVEELTKKINKWYPYR